MSSQNVKPLPLITMAAESTFGVWCEDHRYTSRAAAESPFYTVDITENVFGLNNPLLGDYCIDRSIIVFTSKSIDRFYGDTIRRYFNAYLGSKPWRMAVLESGEQNKNLAAVEHVCRIAKDGGIDRHGLFIAIGGGIICDVVGFAASIYTRGIRYIKINTTLVGQIDVGVGVKTGVNFSTSKNLLGTFYPAYASIVDCLLLRTLPEREIRCGLAEIIKVAIVLNADLFALLERHYPIILQDKFSSSDPAAIQLDREIIHLSIWTMMNELNSNLYERDSAERLADFGHTFSPIIEVESEHAIKHGEAVAIDMALSSRIATLLGRLTEVDYKRIMQLLLAVGLPVFDPKMCTLAAMQRSLDAIYLRRGRRINLAIPTALGCGDFLRQREELPAEVLATALTDLHSLYLEQHRA